MTDLYFAPSKHIAYWLTRDIYNPSGRIDLRFSGYRVGDQYVINIEQEHSAPRLVFIFIDSDGYKCTSWMITILNVACKCENLP